MPEMQRIKTKVCLVGEAAVGKTSLIRRFVQDDFDDRYITTLGAKESKREIVVDMPDRKQIQMDITIWDIMGEKGFHDIVKAHVCTTDMATIAKPSTTIKSKMQKFTVSEL